jgi:DNA polymerase-3 subunit gamma/tau
MPALGSSVVADQPYQSLYRRYRPQRFSEVRGQEHVSLALRNAVREGKVAHAYLFSGPRGTGKTSTARILAKALNCDEPEEGEPCGRCPSCVEITRGASLDVHELDAASNNGVDAMRDLVARASLGTPGRSKVYIVDEVHMLSQAASNALLKTLEEPPPHVVFVLATTDPQRVLPTVRSRTQHFEFRLLGPDLLAQLLKDVRQDAAIDVPDELLETAVRRGNGSARDALSALDQAAAGPLSDDTASLDEVLGALADHDPARALRWLAEATSSGRDPHRTASELVERLHQGFLALMAPDLVSLPRQDRERLTEQARRLGPAAVVRAMELLGRTQVDLREAVDPKVALEVALVRLTRPDLDSSVAALEERIERLERHLPPAPAGPAPQPVPREPSQPPQQVPLPPSQPGGGGGGSGTRAEARSETAPGPPQPAGPPPGGPPSLGAFRSRPRDPELAPQPAAGGRWPTREELVLAWGDRVLASLRGRAKAVYPSGRFISAEGGVAVFALPDEALRSYCEACRSDVEAVLSAHFGVPIRLKLVTDPGPAPPPPEPPPDEPFEGFEAGEGQPLGVSPTERLLQVFPGAEEL